MKTALIVRKDFEVNKIIAQALAELGFENVETVHSFTEAAIRIREGVDAVVAGSRLNTAGETGVAQFPKSGIFVARTAKDAGVPHVVLATASIADLHRNELNLLKGIPVIDISATSRNDIKILLAEAFNLPSQTPPQK